MSRVKQWLADLGLEQYTATFEANDVTPDVLSELTEPDLVQLGVSLGHRKRIVAALRGPIGDVTTPAATVVESMTAEGERRQVTVLFCDLVGSTALSNSLDPEDYRRILASYQETCIACVQSCDGFVAQVQGDGIVAYFGYPRAHEGEAERAIRAAFALMEAVAGLDAGIGRPLSVHLGAATGMVVVSHILAPEKSAVGETPNLAARLLALAQPGEILVSERTQRLAGGAFDYADRGMHRLKGIADPARVWQVLKQSNVASRFEAATQGSVTPMVGREQEVTLLLDRWQLARGGEGQAVLIRGEPGIGKSRMLRAFRERSGEGAEVAMQCSTYAINSAFFPVADRLARMIRFEREDTADEKLDKIERFVRDTLRAEKTSGRESALLARVLAIPCDHRYGASDGNPQRQKDDTIALLVALLADYSVREAAVVVFEDVHWADPTTLEVLTALIDRIETLPLLALITYRPEFDPPWLSRPHVTLQALTRLSRAQGANIVARVAGKALPAELVSQIVDKTDGVPLFLEELTKAVVESNIVVDRGDRYEYSGKVDKLDIPNTLRDSLMARLDRLIPVKEIAQIGACLGREFSYELVRAVSPMGDAQLDAALAKLTASELVFRRETTAGPVYIFKHALVQDTAYDSLLKTKRQTLHAQIAQAILQRFPDTADSRPDLLAHHYSAAGMTAEAIVYWHRAGDLARRRFALQEVVHSYRQAVALLESISMTPEDMRRYIDIAVNWADLIVPSAEVIAALTAAKKFAGQLEDVNRLGKSASFLGQLSFYVGQFDIATPELEQVIAMADRLDDRDRVGSSHRCLGQLYLMGYSRCTDGIRHIEQALPIVQSTGNRFEESCCHGLIGLEHGYLGQFDESARAFEAAIAAAHAGEQQSIECWNLSWRSHVLACKGDWDTAAADADAGVKLAERIENIWARDWCALQWDHARFVVTRDPTYIAHAKEALPTIIGHVCIATAIGYLADMLYLNGEFDAAIAATHHALEQLGYGTYFCGDIRAYRIRSMAAASLPNPDWTAAQNDLQEALSIAQTLQRGPEVAICMFRQAQLCLLRGLHTEAHSHLNAATDLFSRMKMTWWLSEAHGLRTQL